MQALGTLLMQALLATGAGLLVATPQAAPDAGGQKAVTRSEQLLQELEAAYEDSSSEGRREFFREWAERSRRQARRLAVEGDPAAKTALEVFEAFYRPRELDEYASYEPVFDLSAYREAPYAVVQEKLGVLVTSDPELFEPDRHITGADVRGHRQLPICPELEALDMEVVCLTMKPYREALLEFLGDQQHDMGSAGIMSPAVARDESLRRQRWLQPMIKLYPGHWSGWRLATFPTIEVVLLTPELDRAVFGFTVLYEGGLAEMRKVDGRWELVRSELTWIQ